MQSVDAQLGRLFGSVRVDFNPAAARLRSVQ
jgi:hypothetical protein